MIHPAEGVQKENPLEGIYTVTMPLKKQQQQK